MTQPENQAEALDERALLVALEAAEAAYYAEEHEGLAFDGAIKAAIRAYVTTLPAPVGVKDHDWQKTSYDLVTWVCADCKLVMPGDKPAFTKPSALAFPPCSALASLPEAPAVPVGVKGADDWRLVPRHPNWEMLERLREVIDGDAEFEVVADALEYVLSVSPQPDSALQSSPPVTAVDGGMVEAMKAARDQILDSYRTWVADDMDAFPRKGQIPRYDQIVSAIAKVEAALASQPAVEGEAVAWGCFRNGKMVAWVPGAEDPEGREFRLPEDTDVRLPLFLRPAAADAGVREARDEANSRAARMSGDWFEFCEMMGENFDTQETVAYSINAKISNLEASLAEAKRLLEWRDMESAPKDGSRFLAFEKDRYFDCWWQDKGYGEAYWMDEADSEPNPSAWMPLPARFLSQQELDKTRQALILTPMAERVAELPEFMTALSEWGCEDPNEQAKSITEFLNSLVGLREYLSSSKQKDGGK